MFFCMRYRYIVRICARGRYTRWLMQYISMNLQFHMSYMFLEIKPVHAPRPLFTALQCCRVFRRWYALWRWQSRRFLGFSFATLPERCSRLLRAWHSCGRVQDARILWCYSLLLIEWIEMEMFPLFFLYWFIHTTRPSTWNLRWVGASKKENFCQLAAWGSNCSNFWTGRCWRWGPGALCLGEPNGFA